MPRHTPIFACLPLCLLCIGPVIAYPTSPGAAATASSPEASGDPAALAGRLGGSRVSIDRQYGAPSDDADQFSARYTDLGGGTIGVTFVEGQAIQIGLVAERADETAMARPRGWSLDEAYTVAAGLLPADAVVLTAASYENFQGSLVVPCHSSALAQATSATVYQRLPRFGEPGDCQAVFIPDTDGAVAGIDVELGDGAPRTLPEFAGPLTGAEQTYLDEVVDILDQADAAVLAFVAETTKPTSQRDIGATADAVATWSALARRTQGVTAPARLGAVDTLVQMAMDLLDQAAVDVAAAAAGDGDAAQRWQSELRESDVRRAQLRLQIDLIRTWQSDR